MTAEVLEILIDVGWCLTGVSIGMMLYWVIDNCTIRILHDGKIIYSNRKHMYFVQKSMEISAAHSLRLNYESKCQNLHGHNWHVRVHCKSRALNENGMVEDFTLIKKRIHDRLDHKNLNDVLGCNPTAENIAKWICEQIPTAYKVSVEESDGNVAIYKKEDEGDEN